MGFEEKTHFEVDRNKCIKCGRCKFGYPEIPYARGVQKDRSAKVHRYSHDKKLH